MYGAMGWNNGPLYKILMLQLCSALDKGEIICPHYLLVYIFANKQNFAIWGLLYERKPTKPNHTLSLNC
jgi:hypothetical protein